MANSSESGTPTSENPRPREPEVLDTRSPAVKAMAISSKITTMIASLFLMAVAGYYVDLYFETKPLFLILGMVFGMSMAGWQLYKLVYFKGLEMDRARKSQTAETKP